MEWTRNVIERKIGYMSGKNINEGIEHQVVLDSLSDHSSAYIAPYECVIALWKTEQVTSHLKHTYASLKLNIVLFMHVFDVVCNVVFIVFPSNVRD